MNKKKNVWNWKNSIEHEIIWNASRNFVRISRWSCLSCFTHGINKSTATVSAVAQIHKILCEKPKWFILLKLISNIKVVASWKIKWNRNREAESLSWLSSLDGECTASHLFQHETQRHQSCEKIGTRSHWKKRWANTQNTTTSRVYKIPTQQHLEVLWHANISSTSLF